MHAKKVLAVHEEVGSHAVFFPIVLAQASPYEDAPVAAQTRPIRLISAVHSPSIWIIFRSREHTISEYEARMHDMYHVMKSIEPGRGERSGWGGVRCTS